MIIHWEYMGIGEHIFTYDLFTDKLTCNCGYLCVRVPSKDVEAVSERHIQNNVRHIGALIKVEIKNPKKTKLDTRRIR